MQRSTRVWIAVGGLALVATSSRGEASLAAPTDPHVVFKCAGPAGLTIEGKVTELAVADDNTTVTITVPLGNLSTGIGLRDTHTKKALEVPTYPTATLSVARSALKLPPSGQRIAADAPANLTLHGQTKPVTVHYDAKGDGGGFAAHGSFHINMNAFGIQAPSYLGVTVKPDVDVDATFHVSGS